MFLLRALCCWCLWSVVGSCYSSPAELVGNLGATLRCAPARATSERPQTAVGIRNFQDSWAAAHSWYSAGLGTSAAGSGLGPSCLTDSPEGVGISRGTQIPGRAPRPPALHQQ